MNSTPPTIELLLLGGGHSHAIVLKQWGMDPVPGVRLTLVSEGADTAYSGMLPGHVAGFYTRDECHIDLRTLAQFAQAQFYQAQAIDLDLERNQVLCRDRPPVRFDWLSIDIGSTPFLPESLRALPQVIPAKPVALFLQRWDAIVEQVARSPAQPLQISLVGGGAGGVELALAIHHRLSQLLLAVGQPLDLLEIHLFQRGKTLLPQHNCWVGDRLYQQLQQRQIQVHLGETVKTVDAQGVHGGSGVIVRSDYVVWVTQAAAPEWLSRAGLAVDEAGFIQVDDQLRSCSHPQVFAAGDIASMVNHPRPKAGVFAVRQGKPLFRNLRRTVQGLPPIPFRPQRQYLSLIGTGDGLAIASRGRWGWESPLLWRWKDRIDRQFMQKFTNLPGMALSRPTFQAIFQAPSQEPPMRCAGCGAKVGSAVLQKVLQRIRASADMSTVVVGLEVPDDAAVVQWPSDRLLVQTVDYFSAIVDDPYLVGQISANHALSDIYAMGAMPHSALAIATIPAASASLQEETLYQLMSGAHRVLQAVGATLMGGHTVEGDQLAFGLTCNGLARPDRLLRKGGLQPGQTLILTKPLGIGTLLAAQMRRQAKPAWIEGAIATMLQSNQAAAACFLEHGATACTDITGFGLVGHLVEMLQASQPCAIDLYWQHLPILAGALETAQQGILSSLHPQNLQVASWISNVDAASQHPLYPLLFDPQTSGGLLASVPTAQVSDCLADLRGSGYTASEAIGQIELAETPSIYLV